MVKEKNTFASVVAQDMIEIKILFIRGQKVMLDKDLAILYGVDTKVLNQAVKRNQGRFPVEFMFLLTREEVSNLKSQFVTSSWGGTRKLPSAFTEHGILMRSSVLNSKRAIQVNIQIMKTFVKFRELMVTHKDLKRKIEVMEEKYDYQFKVVFDAIKCLIDPPVKRKKLIGFHPPRTKKESK